MRSAKNVALATALVLACLPLAGHAKDNDGLDRCIEAFIAEVVPAGHKVEVNKEDIRPMTTVKYGNRAEVALVALGSETGKRYGRGSCVLNRAGSLVSMNVQGSRVFLANTRQPKNRVALADGK